MPTVKNSPVKIAAARTLNLTRVFAAPRRLVFQLWTDPKHVAPWWGPHGFTNPVCQLDTRSGGAIRIDMRGPDGTVYPITGQYRDIVEPERLVFTSAALDAADQPLFEVLTTVTFAEQGGETTLRLEAHVVEATTAADPYLAGMAAGWTQSLERLMAYATTVRAGGNTEAPTNPSAETDRGIVFTRVFDASRATVWRAWTKAEQLQGWFGPKGCVVPACSLDLRPGGLFHYCMRTPDGHVMWGKWTFVEIEPLEKLVVIVSFSDSQGGVSRHPMSPTWPLETLSTMTLTERAGKTELTLRWTPYAATEPERQTFDASHESMQQGWTGTLDRLAAHLARG